MKAFSLIELLVTVAIIAILAAIAVPLYSQYQYKAKLQGVFTLMTPVMESLQNTYDSTGAFPANITINGITFNSSRTFATTPALQYGNIYNARYFVSGDGLGAMVQVDVSGLQGMTGWADPSTTGSAPQGSAIRFAIRYMNGTMKFVCGAYGGYASQEVPAAYLPPSCNCASVSSFYATGTGC